MNIFRTQLLAASAVAGLLGASGAQAAAVNYNAAHLHGNGASSIANILVQEFACLSATKEPLGLTTAPSGAVDPAPLFNYTPVSPTVGNPNYNCASQQVQPNIVGQYVSTGSGNGRNNIINFTSTNANPNPFTNGTYKSETWANTHFAFSDSPLTSAHVSTYNTNAKAAHSTGNVIQVPLFVLPVAVAYSPVYGRRDTGSGPVDLKFNVKVPVKDGAGNPTGGLRMTRNTYCAIFNGTITNWNDPALKADNGNQSLMSLSDDLTRWNTVGVPIKLVGRSENSGTTNIFTRHLDAVCGAGQIKTGAGGTDQLPSGAKSTAVYNKTTGVLASGTEVLGKFGGADGSDGVSHTIGQTIPAPAVGSTTLGGYLGYVGADWVAPSALSGTTLFSAALQQNGTGATFKTPTAANAIAAFKNILPPQSATTGKYDPTKPGDRTNPLDWVTPSNATTGLAAPTVGYPLVGTTNLITYTCFASADTRFALDAFIAFHLGKLTTSSDGSKFPVKLVSNTGKAAGGLPVGILPRNGISPMPPAWQTAVYETFVVNTTAGTNPGGLNLWIQSKLPAKQTDISGSTITSNTGCTAGQGA